MNLVLDNEQAHALHEILELSLRELTHEIAATDNAVYRVSLLERRQRLSEVAETLGRVLVLPVTATDTGEALERELAWPGD